MKNQPNNLYVDLKATLDLRLGLLNLISPEFASHCTKNGSYFRRERDEFSSNDLNSEGVTFGSIEAGLFASLMQKVSVKDTSKNALLTKVPVLATALAGAHFRNRVKLGQPTRVRIHYNLHPLVLTEDERKAIETRLKEVTPPEFEVSAINLPPEQLTLDYCKETYFAMVMYEYVDWVNVNDIKIREKPMRDTCLYVPRLFMGNQDKKTVDELLEKKKQLGIKEDIFDLTARAITPFVPIQFVPVSAFCAAVPENPFSFSSNATA